MMTLGAAAFHARLAEHDPVMAARLAPGDRQRLLRAWEVFTATGRSLADWQAAPGTPSPYRLAKLCLLPPRTLVYAACATRLETSSEERSVGNESGHKCRTRWAVHP